MPISSGSITSTADRMTDKRSDLYKWLKIGGLLSFLPFVLAAGPIAGYVAGDYLEKKFNAPHYVALLCICVGFLAGMREAVRIIKIALRTDKNP